MVPKMCSTANLMLISIVGRKSLGIWLTRLPSQGVGKELGPKAKAQKDLTPCSFLFDDVPQFHNPRVTAVCVMLATCDDNSLHSSRFSHCLP